MTSVSVRSRRWRGTKVSLGRTRFSGQANGYRISMDERRPPDVHYRFDNEPDAPRRARRALSSLFIYPADPISEAVELAASELVTNVVIHTESGGLMRAWDPKPANPFRLEVEDHAAPGPISPPMPDDSGGRGLIIVDNVADAWGVEPTDDGKTIWAEFNRPSSDKGAGCQNDYS